MKTFRAAEVDAMLLERGMCQSDVARALGITRQSVGAWFRDECLPRRSVLKQLADLLGVRVQDLILETRKHPEIPLASEMVKHDKDRSIDRE